MEGRRIYGRNPDVGATFEPVTPTGTAMFLQAGVAASVVSDSLDDAAGGIGARKVTVQGLDVDGNESIVTVALGGIVAVATGQTLVRMNAVVLPKESVGTYAGSNIGKITVTGPGVGVIGTIEPGNGTSHSAVFTVPLGQVGYITGSRLTADSNKAVSFRLCARLEALKATPPFGPLLVLDQVDGVMGLSEFDIRAAIRIPALTDIFVDAAAQTPAIASARLDIFLVDEKVAVQP